MVPLNSETSLSSSDRDSSENSTSSEVAEDVDQDEVV